MTGEHGKVCPLSFATWGPGHETARRCIEHRCAWYMDSASCAVPAIMPAMDRVSVRLSEVDRTLERFLGGYDQRGMLVRTMEA